MDTYQDDDMSRYWAAESAAAYSQQQYYLIIMDIQKQIGMVYFLIVLANLTVLLA